MTTQTSPLILSIRHLRHHPAAFQNADEKILVLTDEEIFGEVEARARSRAQKISKEWLSELHPGDLVIHLDHGIAQFSGITQKTVAGVTREYLSLQYRGSDRLFVPVAEADKVSKYLGGNGEPQLSKLGSAEWAATRTRVFRETKALAKELLTLYAQRAEKKGAAMDKVSKLEAEFDEAFPYELTDGQRRATEAVRADMASPRPMDRLVCGDVGFGKTEVAMRAAFRAVMNGKQVAVLTPITILADQHFQSFRKRMNGFPVRIGVLSRFQSEAEQTDTLEKTARGEIDILVGTHRILSDDVKFKNLGLLIVDEEQRFGVKQKEKLKKARLDVDVLTMTATPIPRTLNMGLGGLRDISTISTPPQGRRPIITEVRKFSMSLIREALLREKARGGQAYVLHNRVATIDSFAEKLRALIPEMTFVVTHGKLGEHHLEERIKAFKDGEYDVLVSSTIIENGIDLPRANTLLVDRAEAFGLGQLHQLRGRVGRSDVQAYAFFLYHAQKLEVDAKKRLKAILEASDLGAGFQLAMRDLEIRGAGAILGAEQSGAMDTVGVAHFTRMLSQAVEDLRSGKLAGVDEPVEVQIELPISGYIPDSFVADPAEKVAIYQKLSSADTIGQLEDVLVELAEVHAK